MSSGTYQRLQFKPGIVKDSTEYEAEGSYVSCDRIRFRDGLPEQIGGWSAETPTGSIVGVARDIHAWKDLNDRKYLSVGTNKKLQTLFDGQVYDITPKTTTVNSSDIISTVSGSTQVALSITAHGLTLDDHIAITSVASSIAGIDPSVLKQDFVIVSVSGANELFIDTSVTATATTVGGGTTQVDLLLPIGESSNKAVFGWGAGAWSEGTWGTERSTPVTRNLRQWSLDNWGEDLIACPRGGKIYHWDATDGVNIRASAITAAPSVNNIIIVAQPKRNIVSYGTTDQLTGTYDPLLIRWCDSENFRDWTASIGNEAGEYRLGSGNEIVGVTQSKRETIVLTDDAVYSQKAVGSNFVFGFDRLGSNSGLLAQHAVIDINGVVYWMGRHSFFKYDGVLRPLRSTLDKFIFDEDGGGFYNIDQKEKIFCGANTEYHEIIWLYPSKDSETNDRYIIYNYLEDAWYPGTLSRSVWLDAGIFDKPRALCETSSCIFVHEQGTDANGSALDAYLESSWFDIGEGDAVAYVDRVIPDFRQQGAFSLTLKARRYPNADFDEVTKGPYTLTSSMEKVDLRIRGRQMKVIYEGGGAGTDFEIGRPRIRVKPDGKR